MILVLREIFGVYEFLAQPHEAIERSFLVGADQSAIPSHVGGKDRCQLAFDALRRHQKSLSCRKAYCKY